ncbi:MAG: biotin-dependent carboxyltransferase family protein [Spartobacteria bacterium]
MNVTIFRAGFSSTIQDLGRFGSRQSGVSVGGALDPHALRVANLLVGNDDFAAGIEITFGGLQMGFSDERLVAWCGGEFEVDIPAGHAARMRAGDHLTFGKSKVGCRSWLAIAGGVDVPPVLGSRSTDLRAKFGGLDGRALRDGDELALGPRPAFGAATQKVSSWSAPHDWSNTARAVPILRVIRGTDWDLFSNAETFWREEFAVTPDSNRMGARLEGAELKRKEDVDLVSEAVAPGTIQVPPNGQPIVLLGDCQTIGGYPKIAHVITIDLPIAAQLRAGDRVRFREIELIDAHRLLAERERDFACFRTGLSLRA